MDLSGQIAAALADIPTSLNEFERLGEARRRLLALPGVETARSTKDLVCAEHKIIRGVTSHLRGLEETLRLVAPLKIGICPELVSRFEVEPDRRYGALLVRYAACVGESLVPGEEAPRPFSDTALVRFAADVRTLAEHGFAHRYIRSWYHALVGSETGTIVMDDWGALSTDRDSDVAEMLGHLERLLADERGGSDAWSLPRGRSWSTVRGPDRASASRRNPAPAGLAKSRSAAGFSTAASIVSERGAPSTVRPLATAAGADHQAIRGREMSRVVEVFGASRVLLPVVHPVGREEALTSIADAVAVGVKGIFLINQGMDSDEVLALVLDVRQLHPSLWIGVNLLGHRPPEMLERALDRCDGRIDGIWADNAWIDEEAKEQPEAQAFVDARRALDWNGLYFGGVAFKYQRQVPAESLARAAACASEYMDLVCTSGPGTGMQAEPEKLAALHGGLGPRAGLALASGVTEANVHGFLPYADAYLVGTGIESSFGVLDRAKVERLHAIIAGSAA